MNLPRLTLLHRTRGRQIETCDVTVMTDQKYIGATGAYYCTVTLDLFLTPRRLDLDSEKHAFRGILCVLHVMQALFFIISYLKIGRRDVN